MNVQNRCLHLCSFLVSFVLTTVALIAHAESNLIWDRRGTHAVPTDYVYASEPLQKKLNEALASVELL